MQNFLVLLSAFCLPRSGTPLGSIESREDRMSEEPYEPAQMRENLWEKS